MAKNLIESLRVKISQIVKRDLLRRRTDLGLFYAYGRENLGDSMVPWLVKQVCGREIPYSNPREAIGTHLFTIGSILQYADENSVVWGSGFIESNSRTKSLPKEIRAVRGPYSALRLKMLGAPIVKVFGDPAILTPRYTTIEPMKEKFRIGVIPHYMDKKNVCEARIMQEKSVLLCDIEVSNVQDFVNKISSCDIVVSSSLHGIIIAESIGIPAIWAEFGDKVLGGGFKFHDYYASTERRVESISFYELNGANLAKHIPPKPKNLTSLSDNLLDVFPYELCQ